MDSRFDIIDAFIDGERVNAGELKRVLADADGRDYFVDAWLLRESVQEEMAGDTAIVPLARRGRMMQTWIFAAALIACLVGGYLVGYRVSGRPTPAATPEAAAPLSAPATPLAVPASAGTPAPYPMPTPTRVIQVQFSVDRTSTNGGGD